MVGEGGSGGVFYVARKQRADLHRGMKGVPFQWVMAAHNEGFYYYNY